MNRFVLVALRNLWRLPGAYIKLCRHAKHPERYPEEERWRHVQKVMGWVIRSGNIDLQVSGKENIPQEESFMLYANHQGMFDVVALAATCDRPLGAVYKKELKNVPVLNKILQSTLSFDMDREDVRQSLTVIQQVTKQVLSGRNYLIFPEGTRSKNGNVMGQFHAGSFRAAGKAKCPIVPVAFIDSFKVLDQKGSAPVTVKMYYLKPIPYEEYADLKTVDLAALVKQRIATAMEDALVDT
ncbi:MAG: 1-acyl-sn-glycerol-3-phosphate acyltransferase [Ruminococcaceae bacterium]|nr:1-acyl-sn-glycerol-3-phosphate acyltransferase [Oscillospiraceae bacterium]